MKKRVLNKKKANELSLHSLPLSFSQYFAMFLINKAKKQLENTLPLSS
jgi:hypothetical protein